MLWKIKRISYSRVLQHSKFSLFFRTIACKLLERTRKINEVNDKIDRKVNDVAQIVLIFFSLYETNMWKYYDFQATGWRRFLFSCFSSCSFAFAKFVGLFLLKTLLFCSRSHSIHAHSGWNKCSHLILFFLPLAGYFSLFFVTHLYQCLLNGFSPIRVSTQPASGWCSCIRFPNMTVPLRFRIPNMYFIGFSFVCLFVCLFIYFCFALTTKYHIRKLIGNVHRMASNTN